MTFNRKAEILHQTPQLSWRGLLILVSLATLAPLSNAAAQASQEVRLTPVALMIQSIEARAKKGRVRQNRFWQATLTAIRSVEREKFVPDDQRAHAYEDQPLPIGYNQTISDPYIVAVMTSQLRLEKASHVLEIGTGSGYQAAVLSIVAGEIWTIEIVEPLAKRAATLLDQQGFRNIHVRAGDGYEGWPEVAPFDAIIVTAGAPRIPEPLIAQLKPGGRMIIPAGKGFWDEELVLVTKSKRGTVKQKSLGPVMFVDFTGKIRR
jgi:protein-L-isoaspartate(D-aspartate) O-methyltransferase